MPRGIIDEKTGRTVMETDPDFDRVRADNLDRLVADLLAVIVELQHRVSKLDGENLQWPGDTYPPLFVDPYETSRKD
jgi:hypothetical protein